jgi:hypothetical protein
MNMLKSLIMDQFLHADAKKEKPCFSNYYRKYLWKEVRLPKVMPACQKWSSALLSRSLTAWKHFQRKE